MTNLDPRKLHMTAPNGAHPRQARGGLLTVPDSFIHELERIIPVTPGFDAMPERQFDDADLTFADLLLTHACDSAAMRAPAIDAILAWEPSSPGDGALDPALDGTPPTIAERLQVYLHVLEQTYAVAEERFYTGAVERAQRGLSQLLVDHPILMHPNLRSHIPEKLGRIFGGTCSVGHLVANSTLGHFPMAQDWPAGTAPTDKLDAFARSRIVHDGLMTVGSEHDGAATFTVGAKPVEAALEHILRRPGLLASLHELGLLSKNSLLPLSGRHVGNIGDAWFHLAGTGTSIKDGVMHGFLSACGLPRENQATPEVCAKYQVPAFMALARDYNRGTELSLAMRKPLFQRLFWAGEAKLSTDAASYALNAALDGVVAAGYSDEAGLEQWLHAMMVETPWTVEVPAALGFLRAARGRGISVTPEHLVGYGLIVSSAKSFDSDGFVRSRPGWATALNIENAEHAMRTVIDAGPQSVSDAAAAANGAASKVRRHRAV